MAVRSKRTHDVDAVKAVADNVMRWARYQNLDGEVDNVETSPITGTYDWKAYLHEEAQLARKRENERRPRKAPASAAPAPAPSVFYG
ncbi:MAG TPA: hypothetical protein VNX21_04150 [Candidatus Thermoplasmatota archaeon]|nr:hypothetical protein [Candidatus Thermoplasmatota archaeon]